MMNRYCARLISSRNTALESGSFCYSAFFPKRPPPQLSEWNNIGDWLIQFTNVLPLVHQSQCFLRVLSRGDSMLLG